MILNFPSNPSVNDTYSFGNKTWIFNGQGWVLASTGALNGVIIGNTTPAAGNFTTVGATGNITTDQYFIGNGAFITGLPAGYSNADVANYLPTYTGNLASLSGNVTTSANVSAAYFLGNGAFLTGLPQSYSNANVKTYLESGATINANFDGGSLYATGTANLGPTTINGNLSVAGNIIATGNLTYISVQDLVIDDPLIYLGAGNPADLEDLGLIASFNDGTYQHTGVVRDHTDDTWKVFQGVTSEPNTVVAWNEAVYAAFKAGPILSNATITANANVVAVGNVSGTYLLGNGAFITGLPAGYSNADVANYLPTYTGNLASLSGNVYTSGNISGAYILGNGAFLTGLPASYSNANVKTYLGNFDGNIIPSANVTYDLGSNTNRWNDLYLNNSTIYIGAQEITANADAVIISGNISANYLLGNGALLAGVSTYSNANVANYLASNANISLSLGTGNITTQGNMSVGNLVGSGDNVDVRSGAYTWSFNNTGNLVLPANSFAINYANGTQVALGGSYSNSNVADYLASNANVPITVGVGNISTQGNVTGNYFIGNGALLTGVVTSSYSNANVANYLPTYTGNVGAGNLNLTGNIIDTGALNIITGASGNITLAPGNTNVLTATTTGVNIAGYLNTTGNITVGNLVGSGDNVDIRAGSYNWRFDNTGNLTLPANATAIYYANGTQVPVGYGNANVAAYLPTYTGNLESLAGNVTTSANISGAYILGNGAFLTGLPASYSNANVAAYLPNYQGLISNLDFRSTSTTAVALVVTDRPLTIGGNNLSYITIPNDGNANSVAAELTNHGIGNVLISSGPADHEWTFDYTGNLNLPGNTFAVNYANGQQVSLAGNYSNTNAKAYLESGATINANFGGGTLYAMGNANLGSTQVNGNLVVAGNISATGNITYINVQDLVVNDPLIYLGANNTGNVEDLGIVASYNDGTYQHTGVVRDYTDGTWKVFTGVTSEPNTVIAWNEAVYAPFKAGSILSNSTITANANIVATGNVSGTYLLGNGYFITNIQYGNISGAYSNTNVSSYLASNAAVAILTTGNITTSANITGNYFIGNGSQLTGLNFTNYSNANVANYLPTYTGNIGAGNINVTGNISANGNISVGNLVGTDNNVEIAAGSYTWQFNNAGNLVLPANSFSINYANGTQVALGGSYSNSNVADYLASNANIPITVGVSNISTQGNITGNYFIGNGALLTGVVTSSYSNANVANYLPTYTGNVSAGNLNLTGNIIDTDALNIITGASGNIALAPGNTNVLIATTTGVNVVGYLTATGNIATGNIVGLNNNVELAAGSYTWTFDNTGNFILPGNSTAIYYANGTQVPVGYGNANVAAYLASNANVTVAVGTGNITTQGNITGNYFIGNGALLTGIVTSSYSNANVANYLPTYNGNATFGNVNVSRDVVITGNLRVDGNTTYINVEDLVIDDYRIIIGNAATQVTDLNGAGIQIGNLANSNVQFVYNSTSNVMTLNYGANISNVLNVSGNATATGNITANWFIGNINTTNSLITTGNITANNFIGNGVNTNITAGNYTWTFNDSGNFVLPANSFSINYANGSQVSLAGTYSNSNAAAYLASNANVPITVGVSNISTQGNITGNYFIGNGALLTGVVTSSYSNANVANYLPTYTGNITAGNITATGNVSAGNFSGSGTNVVIRTGSYTWTYSNDGNLTSNGNIVINNGNITGNYFIGNGALLTGVVTSSYSNANVANYLPTYTGNITAGNITATGNVTANAVNANLIKGSNVNVRVSAGTYTWTFNDSGNLVLPANAFSINYANGTQVALGGSSSYSNADVANYLPVYNGNALFGNANVSGNLTVAGNFTSGNILGTVTNVTLAAGSYAWTFNDQGNIVLASNTFAINYANGAQVSLAGTYSNSNVLSYLASNANLTLTVGTGNITTQGNIAGNYFIGNGALLTGVVTSSYSNANVANYLPTYNGNALFGNTTVSSDLTVLGNLRVDGNTTYINVSDLIIEDKDIIVAANANATMSDLNGAGIQIGNRTAGGNITFFYDSTSNVMTLSHGANIANRLVVNGNISANNFLGNGVNTNIVSGTYTWSLDNTGNLTLPGNSFSINYANGTQVTLGGSSSYSNANVANYLPTYTGNVGAGNVVGSGNGVQLKSNNYTWTFDTTGNLVLPANSFAINYANGTQVSLGGGTSYSNSNVLSYLSVFPGNIIPNANITYNLGNANYRWNDLYLANSTIYLGNARISANATALIMTNPQGAQTVFAGTSGNISAGNFIGTDPNTAVVSGSYTWTFDNTGNLILPANAFSINYANGAQVSLGSGSGSYSNANVANYLPTYTGNVGAGNVIATGNVSANNISANNISANAVNGSNVNVRLIADTYIWTFNNTGNLLLPGNSFSVNYANGTQVSLGGSYSNADVANYLPTFTGNVGVGNVNITGNIIDTGALQIITGANGNISLAPNNSNVLTATTSGVNVVGYLNATGNITGGNLIGSGTNVDIGAGSYTWTFNNTGNLVLPGNSFAINYANGTQVSLGGSSSYSNADVANYLPTYTGNVSAGNLNVTGNIVDTGALQIITGANGNIGLAVGNSNVLIANANGVNVTGYLTASGNLTAGNFLGSGVNTSVGAGSYTWTFDNTSNLTLPGNSFAINYANGTQVTLGGSSSYSNANVANYLPTYTGNISAGNYTGSGINVSIAAGTYTWSFNDLGNLVLPGNSFAINYANGTQVALAGTYSNSNVSAYLASNANVTILTTGNITGNYILGNGALLTGLPATYSNANVANYLPTYTGNLSAGNYTGSGINVSIAAGTYTWSFNDLGNLVLPGNSFAVNYANGTQVSLGGSYSNSDVANYLPTYTGNVGAGNVIATGALNILTGANGNIALKVNNSNILVANANGVNVTGYLTASGNLTAGNFLGSGTNTSVGAGSYTWTFDNTSNLTLPGNSFAINYANGTQVSLGGSSSYSNANVANYLPTYTGNVSAGNLNLTGNIVDTGALQIITGANGNIGLAVGNSNVLIANANGVNVTGYLTASGNLTAGNFVGSGVNTSIVAGSYTWQFNNAGNLVLPANAFSINYANGTQVALGGSYSNSNVSAYLASNANVTILTTGNITGNYILGNGSLLTGLPATYSNANVANYLPTYTGNITAGNYLGYSTNLSVVAGSYTWVFNNAGNLVLPANSFSINYANGTQVALGGSYSNSNAAAYLASNANVPITVGVSNITTQGNIAGNFFIGNGSLLTGLPATYSNTNVAAYLASNANLTLSIGTGNITTQGNVSAGNVSVSNGNITVGNLVGSGTNVEIVSGNYTWTFDGAGNLTGTGNVSAGNFVGTAGNTSIVTGSYTWVFNNAGNLVLPANSFSVNYANGTQVALGGSYSNSTVANYLASNANVTITVGVSNITTQGNIAGNYFIGNGALLTGVVTSSYSNANVANYLPTYTGNVGAGNLNLTGNIIDTGAIFVITGANGNVVLAPNGTSRIIATTSGANIVGNIDVAGNVNANGATLTGNLAAGNITVANGNITLGNLVGAGTNVEIVSGNYTWTFDGAGNLTGVGNVSAGNFVGSSGNTSIVTGAYTWTFDSAGNLTAPGNIITTANIQGNTNGFTIGYRDIPQVSWANATAALVDAGKHYYTSAGNVTLTIPSDANVAFPIGATLAFFNRSSANCTIIPQANVNLYLVGNSSITPTANRTVTGNGGGTLTKVDTNIWMISGANVV